MNVFFKHICKILFIIVILTETMTAAAQETVAVGQIYGKDDNNPIPNVNVSFKNTTESCQSNEEGFFMVKTKGKETTLVFSRVGYKRKELKLKPGTSIGMQVNLEEENTLLQEVFVVPGSNPALEMLKKTRLLRKTNDITQQKTFSGTSTVQNMVLLQKIRQMAVGSRIFNQLKKGSLSQTDSSLVIPLYIAENNYQLAGNQKNLLSKNIFSSDEKTEKTIELYFVESDPKINFYDNSVSLFGKSFISPLATMGPAYYNYYLSDSSLTTKGKQYEIHYRTRNLKNLAFIGKMWLDSATLALTGIEAELPLKANLNYIHDLSIRQQFGQMPTGNWSPANEELAVNMRYSLLGDSINLSPEIFYKRKTTYNTSTLADTTVNNFANSSYDREQLDKKLESLNNTPVVKFAKWLADVVYTGYVPVEKIDIGKIEEVARLTDIEGLRLTLPFRTNERLWKNLSLGGYLGYGFKNNAVQYSGKAFYKLKGEKRREFGICYTNDYRRIDYDYNNYLYRENPLATGDEDISSSLLGLHYSDKISKRNEWTFSYFTDWNRNIESQFYVRSIRMIANQWMPMTDAASTYSSLQQQSVTFVTRFSFDENVYDDHVQRIYISNFKPVIYTTMEAGKYQYAEHSGNYAKLLTTLKQYLKFDLGQFNYILEGGCVIGNVPYPLLETPAGSGPGGYSVNQFNMMSYAEYTYDKFINLRSELSLNGLILNQIPVIKQLNLRELFSFKAAYGSLSAANRSLLQLPDYTQPFLMPYVEVGAGITNLFQFLSVQSLWRLTDLNKPGISPWAIRTTIRFGF